MIQTSIRLSSISMCRTSGFEAMIREMQAEMTVEGYEVIAVKSEARPKSSRTVEPKEEKDGAGILVRISAAIFAAMTGSSWTIFRCFDPKALHADGFMGHAGFRTFKIWGEDTASAKP